MNAIGAETFHGQHRGTGVGLQYTCNRIAGIVVSLLCSSLLLSLSSLDLMSTDCLLGCDYCVIRESDNCGSCLYRWCYDDLWWVAWVVVTV